jgi:lysozyme
MLFPHHVRIQTVEEEARSRYAYKDSRGYLTIGIGRLCDPRFPGSGLAEFEQDWLFGNDFDKVLKQIDRYLPWVNELDEARKGAVFQMVFQMGINGVLGFVNSLKLLRAKRYEEAARNMLLSRWAMQTPNRARRVTEQIRTGIWQHQ